jgi:hypothetical protein
MLSKEKQMYSKGDLVADFTTDRTYAREILAPDGNVICHVIEDREEEKNYPGNTAADALLSHLNRN